MKTDQLFPLVDYCASRKLRTLFPGSDWWVAQHRLRAKPTGEFRCPKEDEWYISGAIPEAYHAQNNLSNKFNIAKIVLIETKTIVKETIIETL